MKQRNHLTYRTAWVTLMLILTAACGTGETVGPPQDITGGWELTSGSHMGSPIEPLDSHPVTLQFDDERISGTAACNGFGGTYEMEEDQIALGSLSITEMACEPSSTMELERLFMTAIANVDEVEVATGQLSLRGPDTELNFEAVPPPATSELLGTVWVLDGLISNEAVSSVSGDRATLEFFSDGSFIGSTGCRTLTGSYVTTATGLTSTGMSAQGECPNELENQDNQVVTILEGEYRATIEENRLTLTINGKEGLVYVAESDPA